MGQQTGSTRTAYATARRRARDRVTTREDRGLPHHPANGWIDCPDCEGAGELAHNDTNPHGFGPDPQCDYPVMCDRCSGAGTLIDGRIDPLLDLRHLRGCMGHRPSRATDRVAYRLTRAQHLAKSYGYALLEARANRIAAEQRTRAAEARVHAAADGCLAEIAPINRALQVAA